ncbi:hypothetical protein FANTH_5928 [Fusarium anthophilum]|uniref:Uncharacterized protein n=1 Tax=Fusarium anthophilum TaxID=48485 RepID=A0A8H4ZMF2_9HYPO|nr:hypothetical protein FANTH_5928 [Fusarium anthophilum]
MPSRGREKKRLRDENYTPETPSLEQMVYSIWKSSKETACVISEIRHEVQAINRVWISRSLNEITRRLCKLESDVNTFGVPHQEMFDNFGHFRHQLASIQQELMGSEFEPGKNPVFQGTLRSYLGDLGAQISGVTDRMCHVEDNLLSLEGRLFGQFDQNINPEAGYVMVKIYNELDFVQKLKPKSYMDLTRMVQSQGGVWAKVDTVKLQPARSKGNYNFMIISFTDWDTGDHIRKNPQNLTKLFELEHDCSTLPLTYHLHIVNLAIHQKMGYDYDMKKFLQEQLDMPGVRAKVAYQRLIVQTENLGIARGLASTGVKVFNHHYEAKCCKTAHFAIDCNAAAPCCGLCAEAHESFTCNVQKDFKCCNCGGAHKAWDPSCTDKLSKAEHQKSLFYRNKVPHWALNLEPAKSFKPAGKGNGKTKAPTQGSSSVPSSQESAKRPVGRPKKHSEPNPAGQSVITSFMEPKDAQESQDKEPEPDAMELTTPPEDLEMNGIEVPCTQPDAATNGESSNNVGPSSSHDDVHDFTTLFDENMSTTGADEEAQQPRPESRLSESSSSPSLNDNSTAEVDGNKKKGKNGKNGQNKRHLDSGKGKENATTDPKASTQRHNKDSTTPSSSQESPNADVRSRTGKGKAVAVGEDQDRARSSSGDLPRRQSRHKDARGKRDKNNGNGNGSRDRGRSSTRVSTNRASSKASSRRTNANGGSDSDNGLSKGGVSQRTTSDKTRQYYICKIRPVISYACVAWFAWRKHEPGLTGLRKPLPPGQIARLQKLQYKCIMLLSGAIRATPHLVLEKECHIDSIEFNSLPEHDEDGRFHEKRHAHHESAFDVLNRIARVLVGDAGKRFQDTWKCPPKTTVLEAWRNPVNRNRAIRQQAIRQATETSKGIWKAHLSERKDKKTSTYQPHALKGEWGGESLAYYRGMTRPESTLGMQLRTECVGLNWYLNKCHVMREVKVSGSDAVVRVRIEATCTCGHPNQTVHHMFIECPDLHDARLLLIWKVKHFAWETLLMTDLKVAVHWAMMYFGLEQFSLARLDSMFYVDSGGS